MWVFLAALAAVTFWLIAGRRLWREYRLGVHLARMTNVFEQIEQTRLRMRSLSPSEVGLLATETKEVTLPPPTEEAIVPRRYMKP